MISDRDVAFYHEHGYLVVPGVLERSSIETLRQELDAIVEGARSVTAHTDAYDLDLREPVGRLTSVLRRGQESADAART